MICLSYEYKGQPQKEEATRPINNCHKSMRWLSRKDLTTKPDDVSLNPGITYWKKSSVVNSTGGKACPWRYMYTYVPVYTHNTEYFA